MAPPERPVSSKVQVVPEQVPSKSSALAVPVMQLASSVQSVQTLVTVEHKLVVRQAALSVQAWR